MKIVAGYHWRDGWFFSRLPNGDVRIRKMLSFDSAVSDEIREFEVTIPLNDWVSIVAEVSAEHGSAQSFGAAQRLHDSQFSTGRARSEETDG